MPRKPKTPTLSLPKPEFHALLEALGFKLTNTSITFRRRKLKCAYCQHLVTKKNIALTIFTKPPLTVCNSLLCLSEYFEDHPTAFNYCIIKYKITKRRKKNVNSRRTKSMA